MDDKYICERRIDGEKVVFFQNKHGQLYYSIYRGSNSLSYVFKDKIRAYIVDEYNLLLKRGYTHDQLHIKVSIKAKNNNTSLGVEIVKSITDFKETAPEFVIKRDGSIYRASKKSTKYIDSTQKEMTKFIKSKKGITDE